MPTPAPRAPRSLPVLARCVAFCLAAAAGPACTDVIDLGWTPCTPETCSGCCSPQGRCLPGDNEYACGEAAASCQVCAPDQVCREGGCLSNPGLVGTGESGTGSCGPQSCEGCCAGDVCFPVEVQAFNRCGLEGAACVECGSTEDCVQGTCAHVERCRLTSNIYNGGSFGLLEFGDSAVGSTKAFDVTLKNVGDAPCDLSALEWLPTTDSGAFSFNGQPSYPLQLPSGQTARFPVTFTPWKAAAWSDYRNGFTYTTNDGTPSECDDPTPGCHRVIVTGRGIASALSPSAPLLPGTVDFGEVALGCDSGVRQVLLVNESAQPLTVKSAWTTGVGFEVAGPLPSTLAPWSTATIDVRFTPKGPGKTTGTLAVKDSLVGSRSIPLIGVGAEDAFRTFSIAQSTGSLADVLVVVHDGAAMGTLQEELGLALGQQFQRLVQRGASLHVGVLSTNVSQANAGLLRGSPKFITSSTLNPSDALASSVRVGTGGAVDQSLEAVRLALAPSRTEDPLLNGGFLRSGGRLGVIFLSDTEEASGGSLTGYSAALRASVRSPLWDDVKLYPLLAGAGCKSGSRYVETTSSVGGLCQSTSNLSAALDAAFTDLFSARDEYVLPQPLDTSAPWSVTVDGVPLTPAQVMLEPAHNSVKFATNELPEAGQTITVHYQALCHP